MNYLLDNIPTEQQSPYGCWNAPRPLNGIDVCHNHSTTVIAKTVWKEADKGQPLPCLYGRHEGYKDVYCNGCKHVKDMKK